jgi:hypothetical protein
MALKTYGAAYFAARHFTTINHDAAAPVIDEEPPRIHPGACFPFGSADLIRIRRKKRRRETDLLFLGR